MELSIKELAFALAIFILTFVPAWLLMKWLVRIRVVRDHTTAIILNIGLSILIKLLWFNNLSWGYFYALVMLSASLGINGPDIWTTLTKGKGWWND